MKLTKEEVKEFLRLKDLIEKRAEAVCKDHFMKTHYIIHDNSSRSYHQPYYGRFLDVVESKNKQVLVYKWYEWEDEEDWSIPIEALWGDIEFPDIVSRINKEREVKNKEIERTKTEEKDKKEREEYERLRRKFKETE